MTTKVKENQCPNCFKMLSNKYKLIAHLNKKNPCQEKKEKKEFKCEKCRKVFSMKHHLQAHMNRKIKCTPIISDEVMIEKEKTKQSENRVKEEEIKLKQIEKELSILEIKQNLPVISNLESTEPKIQYCYVISNDLNIVYNRFKFGRTTCNQKDLIGCYSRGLPNAQVLLYYETDDYIRDENHVLDHFKEHRISHGNRKSEWLQIEFERLKDFLDIYFENNVEDISDQISEENIIETGENY